MSRLLLVRHGQASFFGDGYDQLSPLGHRQARRVGEYLHARRPQPDRVWVGPLQRHRQTHAGALAAVQAAGGAWPSPVALATLDEHQAAHVVKHVLDLDDAAGDGGLRTDPGPDPGDRERVVRDYFRRWRAVCVDWIAGRTPDTGAEPWAETRRRAASALAEMTADAGPGETRLAFSSGGLISMIVGEVLGLGDEQVLDLSLVLANAALVELRFSSGRVGLDAFNIVAHLEADDLLTMV